mgnify:CR=1 FL=1
MRIGVLALQGAVTEHIDAVTRCGARAVPVKTTAELHEVDGLIIPGGESTTIGRLMVEYGLDQVIKEKAADGLPVFGTCAGLILLAEEIAGHEQPHLRLMKVRAVRNSFGRQRESFETDLSVPVLGERPFRAVFIRAPHIDSVGAGVEVLARVGDRIVFARQGHLMASAFHPELVDDLRIHKLFLEMCSA